MTAPDPCTERLVVLQLLGIPDGRPRHHLHRLLSDLNPNDVDQAISELDQVGVLAIDRDTIRESPALDRLDQLQLISI